MTGQAGRYVDVVDGDGDGIATVTWSRSERRNAIGVDVCDELTAALRHIGEQKDVHVVVLSSALPPFCAGWDTSDFARLDGAGSEELAGFFRHGRTLLTTLGELPQLTVAAAGGAVLGFGCALLTRCDIVLAGDDCVFGLPEVALGMPPATAVPELLSVMTPRAVLHWASSGDRFGADRARADGLVTHVVPAADLSQEAVALARRLAGHPDGAARATKHLVRRMAGLELDRRVAVGVESAISRFAGQVPV